jgi:hypothetical protein
MLIEVAHGRQEMEHKVLITSFKSPINLIANLTPIYSHLTHDNMILLIMQLYYLGDKK